jgi:hypothetical protein
MFVNLVNISTKDEKKKTYNSECAPVRSKPLTVGAGVSLMPAIINFFPDFTFLALSGTSNWLDCPNAKTPCCEFVFLLHLDQNKNLLRRYFYILRLTVSEIFFISTCRYSNFTKKEILKL